MRTAKMSEITGAIFDLIAIELAIPFRIPHNVRRYFVLYKERDLLNIYVVLSTLGPYLLT